MNVVEICDKCKANNVKSLVAKIREIDSTIDIKIHCIQYCGIGRDKIVILYNHLPIIGSTEDEVINILKIKILD